jgi:hypothetical protein
VKIAIVSDSHDQTAEMAAAVKHALILGAKALLHCGDVVSPGILEGLARFDLDLHVVHGNNPAEPGALAALAASRPARLRYYGPEARFSLAGRAIYMTHFPTRAKAAAGTGEFDLVCCGHYHTASITPVANARTGTTWLVNPGTVGAVGQPATYVLGDLERLVFEVCYP